MINKINLVVFIGLIISAFCIFFGYFLHLKYQETDLFAKISIAGDFTGWFFGTLAVVLFFFGSLRFLLGYVKNYWNDFYALNIGLVLLGLCFASYNPNQHPLLWIFISIIFAVCVSTLLHALDFIKYRPLLLILIISTFLYKFWSGLMAGIIFMTLSLLSGVSKVILEGFGFKSQVSNHLSNSRRGPR